MSSGRQKTIFVIDGFKFRFHEMLKAVDDMTNQPTSTRCLLDNANRPKALLSDSNDRKIFVGLDPVITVRNVVFVTVVSPETFEPGTPVRRPRVDRVHRAVASIKPLAYRLRRARKNAVRGVRARV